MSQAQICLSRAFKSPLAAPAPRRVDDDIVRRYQAIASNPKYKHFTQIPERIVRCLDHVGLAFDRETVRRRLLVHYLFIGVVDDAIDSGTPHVAEMIFDCLLDLSPEVNAGAPQSDVAVVTEFLKDHINDDAYPAMVDSLRRAYQEVADELIATSIEAYIEHRKALGRATAEQSYLLVRSALGQHEDALNQLMQDIGAVGCLVDSLIDLRHDSRAGLISFNPTIRDLAKLCSATLRAGLRVWATKPSLTRLFVEAIIDNIRDREPARVRDNQHEMVVEREERAGSIA